MKITTIGRGNVGGGLAQLWRQAGHEVDELGSDGGDASGADVVVLATPFDAVADALGKVSGLDGKVVIDATNRIGTGPPEGFSSGAEHVKSLTGGPVAKCFNLNFARLYDEIGDQGSTPSQLYAADDDARDVTEQLIRDAGFEPVSAGGLDKAGMLEDGIGAGQQSRVDAVKLAVEKARERGHDLAGSVLASDAFFPYPDGPQAALDAGVAAIIQPGGSKRDSEVIDAVEAAGAAMVFTGTRHFRH